MPEITCSGEDEYGEPCILDPAYEFTTSSDKQLYSCHLCASAMLMRVTSEYGEATVRAYGH